MKLSINKLFKSQWSYLYAGVVVGIAQIIYMIGMWIAAVAKDKKPLAEPITVTTDLGKMFRGMEVFFNNLFGFKSELYGKYGTIVVDGVEKTLPATGGAFVPGIGWPIVGMIIGGWLVARMEKEGRGWAYYSKKALLISFIGGAFFSYGTRLAGGCTLNHLMGGVPLMNIHSLVTIIFMAIGGALGFLIMSKLGLANYFKHQETKSYVEKSDQGEQATLKKGYKPLQNPIYWIGLIFALLFVFIAIYGGLFNPESYQHIKVGKNGDADKIVAFGKSIKDSGLIFVILTVIAGIVAGIGMGKSGFGTECSLVSAEVGTSMSKNDNKYAAMGVPRITRTLMRSYTPIIGIATHWLFVLGFVLLAWLFMGVNPGFEGGVKYSLQAGSIIGGLFLGIGAVTLIGCEIRSYMRVGLGYINTLVGFIGFAVGYLPFTLFYKQHEAFMENTVLIGEKGAWSESYKVYQLITDNEMLQKVILVVWFAFLAWLLFYFIKKGMKNTGLQKVQMVHFNTEDIQDYIDDEAKNNKGLVHGIPAPEAVPSNAYPKA